MEVDPPLLDGTTLLLRAKRILYQKSAKAACLAAGNLLDEPIGDKIA